MFCRQGYSLQKKINERLAQQSPKKVMNDDIDSVFTTATMAASFANDVERSYDDMNYGEDEAVRVMCRSIIAWNDGEDVLQGFKKYLQQSNSTI